MRERERGDGDDEQLEQECPDDDGFAAHLHRTEIAEPASERHDDQHGEREPEEDGHGVPVP